MNRKDECFQIGDASTPEEVLAKSMNQPTAPDPTLRERIAEALWNKSEANDTTPDEASIPWGDVPDEARGWWLGLADAVLAALALVPVAPRGEPEVRDALRMALDWIDAVPKDLALPAMPGFDRDWVEDLLAAASPVESEGT